MAYKDLPFKEWDGKTPLVIFGDDKYFFDSDDIESYLEEINGDVKDESEKRTSTDLQLMICEPNRIAEIDFNGLYGDVLPEDMDIEDVVPNDILHLMNELNKLIKEKKPILSWSEGKFRTTVDIRS